MHKKGHTFWTVNLSIWTFKVMKLETSSYPQSKCEKLNLQTLKILCVCVYVWQQHACLSSCVEVRGQL